MSRAFHGANLVKVSFHLVGLGLRPKPPTSQEFLQKEAPRSSPKEVSGVLLIDFMLSTVLGGSLRRLT